jgi:PIN domain nuclease of toxin-antitoxin system
VIVFDASALLAFLRDEPGASTVEEALLGGGACGAANWAEVAQQVRGRGGQWLPARALLLSYPLEIEPVTEEDAEVAAEMWSPGSGLSLGDRLCLALAQRLDADVLTADRAWGEQGRIRQIR